MFKGYAAHTTEYSIHLYKSPSFDYTGHRLDHELNHDHAKFRYYNSSILRWLSPDPVGIVDGPNAYAYAYIRGNPVSYMDNPGLYTAPCRMAIAACLGCIGASGQSLENITGSATVFPVQCFLACIASITVLYGCMYLFLICAVQSTEFRECRRIYKNTCPRPGSYCQRKSELMCRVAGIIKSEMII